LIYGSTHFEKIRLIANDDIVNSKLVWILT